MKSKEELNALKKEVESLNKKLSELTEEEIKEVDGAGSLTINMYRCQKCRKYFIQRGNTSYVICECGGSAHRVG